jgi:hypothetical protein
MSPSCPGSRHVNCDARLSGAMILRNGNHFYNYLVILGSATSMAANRWKNV